MEGAVRSGHAAAHEALIARLSEMSEPALVGALGGGAANGHGRNGERSNGHSENGRAVPEVAVEGRQ
jgi:hypothetical protein